MIIDRYYVGDHEEEITEAIIAGQIFIYPTDTIYGIGCNALNRDSVTKIRQIKQREIKPFSIIVPDHNWVRRHCEIGPQIDVHLNKLPGPYTLFLRLKDEHNIPDEVNPTCDGTIGVRMPNHWFAELIRKVNVPFITTSVNVSGMPYMTNMETLDETIKNNVDFIIYEGQNSKSESIKINLTNI